MGVLREGGQQLSLGREEKLQRHPGQGGGVVKYSRYLEGTSAQHSGSLVFGHVGGSDPLLVRLLPLSRGEDFHVLLSLLGKPDHRCSSPAPNTTAPRGCESPPRGLPGPSDGLAGPRV